MTAQGLVAARGRDRCRSYRGVADACSRHTRFLAVRGRHGLVSIDVRTQAPQRGKSFAGVSEGHPSWLSKHEWHARVQFIGDHERFLLVVPKADEVAVALRWLTK